MRARRSGVAALDMYHRWLVGQIFSDTRTVAYDSQWLADNDNQLHTPDDTNDGSQPTDDHTVSTGHAQLLNC